MSVHRAHCAQRARELGLGPARPVLTIAIVSLAAALLPPDARGDVPFVRGDVDATGEVDLADPVVVLRSLFITREPLLCPDAADMNDDGRIDVADGVYGLRYLFLGAAPPDPPFPGCDLDATEDALDCPAFAPCEEPEICLSGELLDEILGEIPGFSFCLPAGLLEVPLEALEVSVCPADAALPCGILDEPGCPVEITSFEPFADVPGTRVGLRVRGRVEDFPVRVTESLFGTSTTCENDLGGEDEGAPFLLELSLPLLTEEVEPGVRRIIGTGEPTLERVDLRLSSSGGLVCILFQAGQDAFLDLLLAPLEQGLELVAEQLDDAVYGLLLCP